MKCVFVGDLEDDAGFVAEVLQEKGIELIEAGVYGQIEPTINPVIEAQADIVVYDLLALEDQPEELVEIINRIQQSRNNGKIIFLAAGKGSNTPIIEKLIQAGYVNFVLESTYGAKKTMFARCLTNYYESNADQLNRELKKTELPHELHFNAFARTFFVYDHSCGFAPATITRFILLSKNNVDKNCSRLILPISNTKYS